MATVPSGCAMSPSGPNGGSGTISGSIPTKVSVEHVGLNHLTWIRSARLAGLPDGDRLEDLFGRFGPELELEAASL